VEALLRAIASHRQFGRIYRHFCLFVRAVRGGHPKRSVPAQASGITGAENPVVRMKEHDA